jgi:hypothetical protein
MGERIMDCISLEDLLKPDTEEQVFESTAWGKRAADGSITPAKLRYRVATVGDREKARRSAKKGESFDNATYGCKLISLCVIEPKIPEMDLDKLRAKNGKEMDRLITAIVGDSNDDPR